MAGESRRNSVAPSNRRAAKICRDFFPGERRRKFFRVIAKHAYPRKTVPEIRFLTRERYGERTIYDWIAGRSDAPLEVCIKIIGEILSD
jgi:hypothetical protein